MGGELALFGNGHTLSGQLYTYIFIRGKYNNINILSSQVNIDINIKVKFNFNIDAFDWRGILKSVQKESFSNRGQKR